MDKVADFFPCSLVITVPSVITWASSLTWHLAGVRVEIIKFMMYHCILPENRYGFY